MLGLVKAGQVTNDSSSSDLFWVPNNLAGIWGRSPQKPEGNLYLLIQWNIAPFTAGCRPEVYFVFPWHFQAEISFFPDTSKGNSPGCALQRFQIGIFGGRAKFPREVSQKIYKIARRRRKIWNSSTKNGQGVHVWAENCLYHNFIFPWHYQNQILSFSLTFFLLPWHFQTPSFSLTFSWFSCFPWLVCTLL